MGKIVNLRAVRKTRERDAKRAQGDTNAAKFGLTKAERHRQTAEAEKARRDLDGHKTDRPTE
ncbi:DUF4169 family protein [Falsirhodobacter sp. 20TX0035]|uniref:DUF4169 family protein n=1 Tax=Falsirhodobacter sp. 20TX0035 TaxID=3022019 RepID=UPI00232CA233|nr:DUF4169 family protein [Falsirhodobacter sp. 20TX0035]MDB6452123.1 DUF4169 family protein [Falsirhodobacter sp. 20TX0035]